MPRRRGNTLPEVVISTVLVGVLMTAALRSSGQTLLARRHLADEALGHRMAAALIAEILQQAYSEPGTVGAPLGMDSGELDVHRGNFDDIDDYHGLVETPPVSRINTAPTSSDWTRTTDVTWVDGATLIPAVVETGVKRITVIVTYQGRVVSTANAIKTMAP